MNWTEPLRHPFGMPPLLVGEALAFRSASSSIGNFSAPPLAAVVAVASGLTDGSRAVSTKKEDPLSELQLREGVFFLVSQMTSSISTFTIYSICHSPQKSSTVRKVYSHSSLGISCIFLAKFMVYWGCGSSRPIYQGWEKGGVALWRIFFLLFCPSQRM